LTDRSARSLDASSSVCNSTVTFGAKFLNRRPAEFLRGGSSSRRSLAQHLFVLNEYAVFVGDLGEHPGIRYHVRLGSFASLRSPRSSPPSSASRRSSRAICA